MLPYATDAPIYYWPKATVAIIVINVLIFVAVPRDLIEPEYQLTFNGVAIDEDDFEAIMDNHIAAGGEPDELPDGIDWEPVSEGMSLQLQYGTWKPWQWLTSIYLHAGIVHLIGNMFFLWAYGIIVEGKVGMLAFLLIYHVIGVGQSAIEQTLMVFANSGGSLGASAAIFGLLGVTVMWAPRNDFDCLWYYSTIEVPILIYAAFTFFVEFVHAAMSPVTWMSSVLHLMGAAVGLFVGGVYIKKNWVDCEGYDLFRVLSGKEGKPLKDERLENEASQLLSDVHKKRLADGGATAGVEEHRSNTVHTPVSSHRHPPAYPNPARVSTPQSVANDLNPDDLFSTGTKTAQVDFDSFTDDLFGAKDDLAARQAMLQEAIGAGRWDDVPGCLGYVRELDSQFELSQKDLYRWIEDCFTKKNYEAAVPLLFQHIRRFENKRVSLQVQLGKLLIHQKQYDRAVNVLEKIPDSQLTDEGRQSVAKLLEKARAG